MTRKFEILAQDSKHWLSYLHRIAEFCDIVGAAADAANKPLKLQLIIHPEEPKVYARMPRLPYN